MVSVVKSKHARKAAKRQEREATRESSVAQRDQRQKKKRVRLYSIIGVVVAVVLVFFLFFSGSSAPTAPGKYDQFAQCLTEKGAKMYGAFWCPHCADQKKMFGSSFKHVDYVECDPSGKGARPQLCTKAGVKSYPTWVINGKQYVGAQQLEQLASVSGCELSQLNDNTEDKNI